jgi:transcriptional regulator with XRE-family HTH domain
MAVAYRNKKQVGSRIVELRDERGLSQTDLARELDFTPSVLCRIEKGERALGAGEVVELADFFGVSVDSILREEDGAFVLRADVDNADVRAALEKFDRDIDTLLSLEAIVG